MKSLLFGPYLGRTCFAVGLAVIFIRGFTKPLSELLRATER